MAPETSFSAILAPRNGSTAPRELFSTTPAKCGTSLFRVSPNGTVTVGTTVLDPVNGIYSPGLSIFGRQNLKRWDAAVANLTYNNSGAIVVAMIGDSWTCNGGYTWQLGRTPEIPPHPRGRSRILKTVAGKRCPPAIWWSFPR